MQADGQQPKIGATPALPGLEPSDREVLQHLEDARQLYERYLQVADLANLAKLIAEKSDAPMPPRTDLPLTISVS